jgi:drug/metabolite transporter (DMT)-like permease
MRQASNLTGIAAMVVGTGSFVVGDSFMKMVTVDLPPFEVLFLRGVAASLACGVLLVVLGDWRVVSSALHPRALLRAAGETLSVLCYIVALARLPIADAIAILQTAPLILILAVAFLLRERVGAARVALALVGFAGAFLVAQPGSAGISPATLLAFASALLIAARDLVGRDVPACIPVMVVTFATNAMVMIVAGAMSSAGGLALGLSRLRRPVRHPRTCRALARLSARSNRRGRALLLQLRALGGAVGAFRLRRLAECSCARGNRAHRRQRRRHRAHRLAPRRGDRPYRGAMMKSRPTP